MVVAIFTGLFDDINMLCVECCVRIHSRVSQRRITKQAKWNAFFWCLRVEIGIAVTESVVLDKMIDWVVRRVAQSNRLSGTLGQRFNHLVTSIGFNRLSGSFPDVSRDV